MKNKEQTTQLNLFLSTGNKITIYFSDDVDESVREDLEENAGGTGAFWVNNWNVSETVVKDKNNKIVFYRDAGDPENIPYRSIIGWNLTNE